MSNLRSWIFDRYLPQNLKARDPQTKKNYGHAVDAFARYLGREPELSDLSDETLAAFMTHLLNDRALAETTVNERAGRIKSFWNWAAKKRKLTGVEEFPTVGRIPVPERPPRAWREHELVKLFNACRNQRGMIGDVPAWRWWFTLHGWLWCTGERIGATLLMQPEHLRLDQQQAVLPAKIRKGKRKAGIYKLWPDLVEMLRAILPPNTSHRERVFPWPHDLGTFYNRYRRMLVSQNLPHDRYSKPHAMRVSHASWRHVAGDDATRALGHSDPATTRKSYLDPTLIEQDETKLFRPW